MVTLLVLAFFGLKAYEVGYAVERWPLTNVAMFAVRFGPQRVPARMTVEGRIGDSWRHLPPRVFGLTPNELSSALKGPAARKERQCRKLLRVVNRRRGKRPARVAELRLRFERIGRPGVPGSPPSLEWVAPCDKLVEMHRVRRRMKGS